MAPRKRRLAGPIRPGETPAQFKARIAAMDRAFTKPPRKPKNAKVIIESPIRSAGALDLRRAYDKETTALRNVAVRIVSDFISEELQGFGKKLSSRQEAKFATPRAAPDAVTSVDEFEKNFGIKISQSQVLKEKGVATFETKIKGTGQSTEPEITSVSLGKSVLPQQFAAVSEELNRLNRTGLDREAGARFLFSPIFDKQRAILFQQTKEKFENFLLFQVTDADKKPTQEFLFSKNPLHSVAFNEEYVAKYFNVRFRASTEAQTKIDPKTGKKVKDDTKPRILTRYRVSITPKPELYKSFDLKPITDKVKAVQTKAGFKVSKEFDKYVQRRIRELSATKTTPAKVNKVLGFLIAFADEFKAGGLTPLVISTTVQEPKVSKIKDFNLIVKGGSQQVRKTQKFISGVQLTQLVQKRLGKTMEKFGDPTPPDLKERSGRFRSSVNIIANYRKNVMMYYYNPIYDNLNKYGYDPSEQVGKATREVVQTLYARAFNIVKG